MADFNGRIKKVRMKETISGSLEYKTVVVVENDYNNEVGSVQVEFQKDMVPKPSPNPIYCKESKDKDPSDGKRRFKNRELKFSSKEINGKTIPVTATMLNLKGEILGKAEVFEVTVGFDDEELA